jgi:hypothetical protein
MSLTDDLGRYLQEARDSVVRALDGLSEYDVRRPVVPSGTNLLGLVKHLTGIELGYLGTSVGRPSPVTLPWEDDGHCDLAREVIDGRGGRNSADMGDQEWWTSYVGRIQAAADTFRTA